MPMIFVIPAVPVETKRLARDRTNAATGYVVELAEPDGTIRRWNVTAGKDGATEVAIAVEATGEQKVSNYGKQSGGALGAFRLNANEQLQVEVIGDSSVYEHVDPIKIPVAQAAVLTPASDLSSGTASDLYEVILEVVNIDGANSVVVSVGVEVDGGGGALTGEEFFIRSEVVPAPGGLGPRTIWLPGNDIIRAEAAVADDAAIHWKIRKIK